VIPYGVIISHESSEFFGIKTSLQVSVYTKKIQVSCEIFLGIPLERDRQCSTSRNSRITEDVRKRTISLAVTEDVLFAELVGFLKMVCFGSKLIFLTSQISEDILHMLRQSSSCRNSRFPKMFDTLRFSQRLPKMFHFPN